jgi:hypothetical protein
LIFTAVVVIETLNNKDILIPIKAGVHAEKVRKPPVAKDKDDDAKISAHAIRRGASQSPAGGLP